jgi:hypothetical protein
MEEIIYKNKLKAIEAQFEKDKIELYREYALSNAKFKIGDLIKDDRWAFVVDKISVSKYGEFPNAVYHGYELKKDLTPRKDKSRVNIYGNDAQLLKAFVPEPKDDLGVTGGTNYF